MGTSQNIVQSNIPICFLPAGVDACALWRMFQPHMNLYGSAFILRFGALDVTELSQYKVAVVQRQVGELNLYALKRMKQAGIKIVYDLDDDIWALPASNPGKQAFNQLTDSFTRCAAEADILTVSTRGLASTAKFNFRLGKEIVVVPNAVDLNLFHPKEIVDNSGFVIMGWGGSNTHGEDVQDCFSVIPDILDKYPNLRMEIVGAPAIDEKIVSTKEKLGYAVGAQQFAVYNKQRVLTQSIIATHPHTLFRPWVPVSEYPNRLASWAWDFMLAPLSDHRFNRSKCLSTETSIYGLIDEVPIRCSLIHFLKADGKEKHLPGPDGKWRKVITWELMQKNKKGVSVGIRGGDFFHVTRSHRFKLSNGKIIKAKNLKIGDILQSVGSKSSGERWKPLIEVTTHLPDRPINPSRICNYKAGWFVGQYVADGCISTNPTDTGKIGGSTSIFISIDGRKEWLIKKLHDVGKEWGATTFVSPSSEGHGASFTFSNSNTLRGLLYQFVGGKDSYTKHLLRAVWRESDEFIKGIIDGWLEGDGHKPKGENYGKYAGTRGNKHVWKFGITRNWKLVRDLQLACLLVSYRFRFGRRFATGFGKKYKIISGSIRKTMDKYQSTRDNGEILTLSRLKVNTVAVEVDGDHLFVLPSGIVTHNSCIKMLEAAALKVPCVSSDVQPYREFAELGGEDLKWLLCRTPAEWTDRIVTLVNEPERRKELGEKMYRVAERFYNAKTLVENWRRVFNKVVAA
jgi:glycosyltransferase involved in cell wall biosynthesis